MATPDPTVVDSNPSDAEVPPGRLARWLDSDVWHSFRSSPVAIGAAFIAALCILGSLFAPWVAPHNPFDLASVNLSDSRLPPAWE
ncbi:MAG: hypothetical protein ABIN96_12430, partial [Rubrivivax sp.]